MDDDVVIAGLILLAMLSTTRQSVEWGTGWIWPVPDLLHPNGDVDHATVSQEFRGAGDSQPHYGVDLMYRSRTPPPTFTAPPGVPILAARSGTLWSVEKTARGWAVVIDHGKPWATFYQHLETITSELATGHQGVNGRGALAVPSGTTIGTMGSDPTEAGHIRHLHFAVWYQGAGNAASIDPAENMHAWNRMVIPWTA